MRSAYFRNSKFELRNSKFEIRNSKFGFRISNSWLIVLFAGLVSLEGFAQSGAPQPNCVISATLTAAGRSASFDNRNFGCTTWHLVYYVEGFTAVSVELDEAPSVAGSAGTWAVWPAAKLASGSLPLTATTSGQATAYQYFPWVSVNLNSVTGTGTVKAIAYGWVPGTNQDASGTSSGVSVNVIQWGSNNVVTGGTNGSVGVGGLAAAGAAVAGNPVLVGGSDGTNARAIATDSSGRVSVASIAGGLPAGSNTIGAVTQASGPWTINETQLNTVALGSPSAYGTSPGAVNVAGVNAFVTNTPTMTANAGTGTFTVGGTVTANAGTGTFTMQQSNVVGSSDPCGLPSALKSSVAVNVTTATTTQLVALSGSTVIYVCGFAIDVGTSATSAATIQFEYGTGTTCGTGTTVLTGTMGTQTATAGIDAIHEVGSGAGTQFSTAAGNALCVVSAGTTVSDQGYVTYVRQ